jgi:hypothetical protein
MTAAQAAGGATVNEITPVDRTPADAPRAGRREWIALAVLAPRSA